MNGAFLYFHRKTIYPCCMLELLEALSSRRYLETLERLAASGEKLQTTFEKG